MQISKSKKAQDEYKGRLAIFFEAPVFISLTPI
jgi:hypothetical protein